MFHLNSRQTKSQPDIHPLILCSAPAWPVGVCPSMERERWGYALETSPGHTHTHTLTFMFVVRRIMETWGEHGSVTWDGPSPNSAQNLPSSRSITRWLNFNDLAMKLHEQLLFLVQKLKMTESYLHPESVFFLFQSGGELWRGA